MVMEFHVTASLVRGGIVSNTRQADRTPPHRLEYMARRELAVTGSVSRAVLTMKEWS